MQRFLSRQRDVATARAGPLVAKFTDKQGEIGGQKTACVPFRVAGTTVSRIGFVSSIPGEAGPALALGAFIPKRIVAPPVERVTEVPFSFRFERSHPVNRMHP